MENRETIEVKGKNNLKNLLNVGQKDSEFECVKSEISSCDEEDGGGWYRVVLKRLSDEKYFQFEYCDWEIQNSDPLAVQLKEVFPTQVTVTIYK